MRTPVATPMTSSRPALEAGLLRRRWLLLAAAGWAGCAPAKRTEMRFDVLTYSVSDMPEAPQLLTIKADGQATYLLRTNERLAERPGIGLYEAAFDAAGVQAVRDMLARGPFAALPDHFGRVPESAPTRTVRVESPDGEVVKVVSSADPVAPRLEQVLSYLDALVLEVMKYPRRVLRASMTPPVTSGGALLAQLEFSNAGREALVFRSPLHISSGGDGWLRIEVWPAVPRPGSLWAEQKVFVEPSLVEPVGPDVPPAATLVLAPGATMRFRLRGPFSAPPGRYQGRGSYCNFIEQLGDASLILGHLLTTKVDFAVQ